MFRFAWAFACGLTLTINAVAATYTTIPGVFSTGVDSAGTVLPVGTTDPHWTITSSPAGAAPALATTVNFMWMGNGASSAWINASGAGDDNAPAGTYVYTLVFSLAGFDPTTAVISGQWTSDNGSTIYLNGVNTGITHSLPWEFTRFDPFQLNSGFIAGMNTLSFAVDQQDATGINPEGLQVDITSALAVVPEPGSPALFGTGCSLYLARRRRA